MRLLHTYRMAAPAAAAGGAGGATPTLRGWISGAAAGSVSLSATTGWNTAAPQSGDFLVAATFAGGIGDPTASTSALFTSRSQSSLPNWGANFQLWTRAFNVADTSYQFVPGAGGSTVTTVVIAAFSGATTMDVVASQDYDFGATANPLVAPSVSATTASGYLLCGFGVTKGTSAATFTTPTGMTSIGSQQNTSTVSKDTVHLFGLTLSASGATGTKSATASASYNAGAAHSIVIR